MGTFFVEKVTVNLKELHDEASQTACCYPENHFMSSNPWLMRMLGHLHKDLQRRVFCSLSNADHTGYWVYWCIAARHQSKQRINLSLQWECELSGCIEGSISEPSIKTVWIGSFERNFRPVSNLPYISKLKECSAYDQLIAQMSFNGLYPDLLSAYVLMNINKGHGTLLVLLDLSSIFDAVDHGYLLECLQSRFGVSGKVLEWFFFL